MRAISEYSQDGTQSVLDLRSEFCLPLAKVEMISIHSHENPLSHPKQCLSIRVFQNQQMHWIIGEKEGGRRKYNSELRLLTESKERI